MPYMTQHEKDELAIVAEQYREAKHKANEIRREWVAAKGVADELGWKLKDAELTVEAVESRMRLLVDGE